jgi:Flp pilus assembly pilin Flp
MEQRAHRIRWDAEDGATMAEYAFLLAGIALVVLVSATALGIAVGDFFANPDLLDWLTA